MKTKILLFLFIIINLTACELNPFNQAVKTGTDAVVKYKKADTLQNLSEIPQDLAEAVADTKFEVKKIEQQVTNNKLDKIEKQINTIKDDKLKAEVLNKLIITNEIISLEQEKTKQIRAENNPITYGIIGVLIGLILGVIMWVLLRLGQRLTKG
jgi:uncharacterized integral membrane protein